MCGRARCTLRADDISRACHLNDNPVRTVQMDRYRPSYNVSPGSHLPVVRREDGSDGHGTILHCMKWGLIPSFTKKTEKPDHYKMFNARSESICEKASFCRLVPNSRCLVVVEGRCMKCDMQEEYENGMSTPCRLSVFMLLCSQFYEWKKDGSKKQPYYIHLKDGRPLVFAALYDSWKNSEGEILYTFTILTTSSSSALQWLHDRMPVILGDKISTDAWLNGSSSTKFDMLLKSYEDSDLVWYPVTPAMGKPSCDGPECIKELKTVEKNSILKFFSTKGVNNVRDLNPKDKSSSNESVETNLPKNMKEESVTEGNTGLLSFTEEIEHDSKSNVSIVPHEESTKCQIKRDYDEYSADSKGTTDEIEKLHTSPVRKKGNLKSAGDKQPTLFSYFGKK